MSRTGGKSLCGNSPSRSRLKKHAVIPSERYMIARSYAQSCVSEGSAFGFIVAAAFSACVALGGFVGRGFSRDIKAFSIGGALAPEVSSWRCHTDSSSLPQTSNRSLYRVSAAIDCMELSAGKRVSTAS